MNKVSISRKLILASLSLSLVTILIVGSYSFYNTKAAILKRTFNQLTSVRVIKANMVEAFFSNCINKILLIKSSSDIIELTTKLNKLRDSSGFVTISNSLLEQNAPFFNKISKDDYSSIYIVGNNHKIFPIKISDSTNIAKYRNFEELWVKTCSSNSFYIRDLYRPTKHSNPIITISTKIENLSNRCIGIMVFEISPDPINAIMLEKNSSNGLGLSGESYLVGSDYLMRTTSRFLPNSILNLKINTEASDSAINNKPGTKIIKDYRNISVLSSYSMMKIPKLNWSIIAEMDVKEAIIPIYDIRNEIILISCVIFLLVLIVIVTLSNKITRPIKILNDATYLISKGNFDFEIKTNLSDEIGNLTSSFNYMKQKLKEQSRELQQQRIKSLSSLIDGQETERQRLSRELHDSLGQLLIGLKLKYESCLNKNKPSIAKNKDTEELALLFDQTIDETRRISNNLMPAVLSEFGLVPAVRNLCNNLSATSKTTITLNSKGTLHSKNKKITTYIFRIIQEALSNIIKHSQASNANIKIEFNERFIIIEITDNGVGFDTKSINLLNSNGINNIKNRVSLLNGQIKINSTINNGTAINIIIPQIKNDHE